MVVDGENIDVTANYVLTGKQAGSLTIAKAPLTIKANDTAYTYDGKDHSEPDTAYDDPVLIAERVTVTGLKGSDTVTGLL